MNTLRSLFPHMVVFPPEVYVACIASILLAVICGPAALYSDHLRDLQLKREKQERTALQAKP